MDLHRLPDTIFHSLAALNPVFTRQNPDRHTSERQEQHLTWKSIVETTLRAKYPLLRTVYQLLLASLASSVTSGMIVIILACGNQICINSCCDLQGRSKSKTRCQVCPAGLGSGLMRVSSISTTFVDVNFRKTHRFL
jgi:hypothetical protein